ncbi:MAG: aminotransferase class IV [Flavobacteriaceae bacterium]
MINFNGTLDTQNQNLTANRAFKYGDAIFETLKVVNGKILFLEDHYFRLMASMRVIRMEIPMQFTMEFLESEIIRLLTVSDLMNSPVRVRMTVFRAAEGLYAPETNDVSYVIESKKLNDEVYKLVDKTCVVDLFKDHYVTPQLLSTLKTNNRVLNVVAGIFAKENELDNCLLLNSNKQVVEAINGNVFLVKGTSIKTPPLTDGCIKGIMRMQLIQLISKMEGYSIEEVSISPFELQKADEIFITNVIQGVVSVTKYRKKEFESSVASKIVTLLNKFAS